MSLLTYVHHFVVSNALTFVYCCWSLFILTISYVINIFNSSEVKLKLEPPSCLFDPKYGVHKYIKVNNIKLHYVESGDSSKPLMILVHGFPEFWYSWRYQIVEFQKKYWVIAIDMRGYGDSERPDGVSSYKLDLLAADIRDLIRQLGKASCRTGREKCILIGHDWGGVVTCYYRDSYPETLDAAIVIGSTSVHAWYKQIWTNPEQRKMSWYIFLFRAPCLPECVLQLNNLQFIKQGMLVPGKTTITEQDIECFYYWLRKHYALTYPINYYRAVFKYVYPEKPHCESKVPMLAALGDKEMYLSKNILQEMKQEYDYIETTIVEDCGHFLQQEEPEKTNKLIKDFLSKNNL